MSKPDRESSTTDDLSPSSDRDPAYLRAIALLRAARDGRPGPGLAPNGARGGQGAPSPARPPYDRARAWALFQQKIGASPPAPVPPAPPPSPDVPDAPRRRRQR